MTARTLLSTLLVCLLAATTIACGDTDSSEEPDPTTLELELELTGVSAVGPDYVLEGWLITDDGPVSTGRFDIGDDLVFDIDPSLADANTFVLTIEPAEGDDPAPSAVHILAGDRSEGSAPLTVSHPAALGTDFADAAGVYILETPTTADIADDYAQGIWFLDPAAGPAAGLTLPELPEGWTYEGWVVGPDGPVSTGRFESVKGADSDGAGPTAGPASAPAFPGQDFIDPAVVLTDYKAVLTVEPVPDTSAAPFDLKPLIDDIDDVGAGKTQAMTNQASGNNSTGIARW